MTTGNISTVSDVSNLMTLKGNVSSIADTKGLSFASLMSAVSDGNQNNDAGTDAYKPVMDNDITKVISDSKTSKPVASGTKTENSKDVTTESDNRIQEAYNDIREAVKEELDITDEELDAALEILGMTVADLIVPQNTAMLVAEVNNTDVTNILTDEALADNLGTLTQEIADIVQTVESDTGIPAEEFKEAVKNLEESLNSTADTRNTEIPTESVSESQTKVPVQDKEIEVTVENHREETVNDEKTQQGVNVTETQTSDEADSHKDNGHQTTAKEFAQNIVQNLNQSVNEVIAADAGETFSVSRTDIVEQMLEAVRVNVTPDTTSMEIQLTPEHLGKINLNVATRNGIITATITAQNESVGAAIENQVIQLKESMNNQGLKVENVEVTVASHEFSMNYDNNGDSQNMGNGKNNSSRRFRTEEELASDETAAENTERQIMEANGNSVSYTA
ncbi:MAG: flagellar hook-length control protein FliK [Lachnospiraceae bacterium]|nr:flagellar hook-length control protein FliK [Lachnospiraceae bacterium]